MHATACAVGSMCRRLPSRAADTSLVAGGAPGSSTSTTSVHSWLMSCARPTPRKPSKVLTAQADYTQRRLPARWPAPDGSDGLLHGVDRLNERPNRREGSADTATPRRCRKRFVSSAGIWTPRCPTPAGRPRHAPSRDPRPCPRPPLTAPTVLRLPRPPLRPPPDSPLVVVAHAYQLAAARSLPLPLCIWPRHKHL